MYAKLCLAPVKKDLKKKVIEEARKCGADMDGDIVTFDGKAYYVNIVKDKVGIILKNV